jgi:hypothetical protein
MQIPIVSPDLLRLRDALRQAPGRTPRAVTVAGATEAARAALLGLILPARNRPVVIVTAHAEQAAQLADDLQTLLTLQAAGQATGGEGARARVRLLPPPPTPITAPAIRPRSPASGSARCWRWPPSRRPAWSRRRRPSASDRRRAGCCNRR